MKNPHEMTAEKWVNSYVYKIWSMTGGHCFYCGVEVAPNNAPASISGETMHKEHYIPRARAKGRKNNIVPSCTTCNARKSNLSITQFRQREQRRHIPTFTEDQRAFLARHDVDLVALVNLEDQRTPETVFWAENNGWTLADEGFQKNE
jgi:hypothetical protein